MRFVVPLLLVFGAKALFLISGGLIYGRLSLPPPYDDVVYFVDATERLLLLRDHGLLAVLQDIWARLPQSLPHAPYSTAAAMIAFGLGGPHLAGPYLMNALALALILAVLAHRFEMSLLTAGVTAAALTSTKWFDDAVTIYHPDLVAGFAAAAFSALLIWQTETITTRRAALGAAAFAALTLLVKPVAAGMILLVWTLAFICGAALAYRRERSIQMIKMRLLFGALPAVLLVSPYFVNSLAANAVYIYKGFVEQRETWAARVPSGERDWFYAKQAADVFSALALAGSLVAGSVAALAAVRRETAVIFRFSALAAVAFVAGAVPQYIDTKHYLYGAILYGGIAVGFVLAAHYVIDKTGLPTMVRGSLAALVAALALLSLSDKQGRYDPIAAAAAHQEYDGVYRLIERVIAERRRAGLTSPDRIAFYAPLPVPVPPPAYRFRGLLDRVQIVPIPLATRDLPPMVEAASKANVVVVPDLVSIQAIYPYLERPLIPAFRAWLERDTRLRLIGTVKTELGSADVFADVSR